MTNEVLDNDLAQAGGWTTVVGTFFLWVLEWLAELTVNDFLQGVMLIGSIIFLWYKIVNARLDAKLKRKVLKDEERPIKKT
jgi:hypothetical protein